MAERWHLQHGLSAQSPARIPDNLKRLQLFVAVAEELHFARAANRMNISQPPLTKHIQILEEQFGAKLFTRNRRRVSLTPAGQVLLKEARGLIAHAERVGHVMQGASNGEFTNLFLGCVPFALFDVLPEILIRFKEAGTNANIVLSEGHTGDVMNGVSGGRLDFGIVWKNFPTARLSEHALVSGDFVAVFPKDHPLLAYDRIDLSQLSDQPLVLPSRQQSPYHHDRIIASFVAAGLTPRVDFEVPMILSQLGYVASGLGIAIVPDIAQRLPSLRVAFRPIARHAIDYSLTLVWSESRLSDVGRRFVETARTALDDRSA